MKIVCDSCSAKYSIADEKVAGRVFKIRCKKCGAAIVVRGDQQGAEAAAAPGAGGYDYGGEAVWHAVVDGDQQGPFTPAQLGAMISESRIGWDAYVWREGFDDWKPAQDIEELVQAIMNPGGAPAAEGDPFGAEADAPAAAPAHSQRPAASAAARDAGADLFAPSGGSPFGGGEDDDVVSSAPAAGGPRVSAQQAMTGQRNENSVLFSLSNLQALATGAPGAAPSSASKPAAAKPGMATGEGSGLIDIRALASATGMGAAPSAGPAATPARVDDLLSIGAPSVGLGSALAAPVIIADKTPEKSGNGMLFGGLAVGASIIAAAAIIAVVMLNNAPDPAAATGAAAIAPGATPPAAPVAPTAAGAPAVAAPGTATATAEPAAAPAAAAATPTAPGAPAPAAAEEAHAAAPSGSGGSGGSSTRRRGGGGGSSESAAPAAAATPSSGGGGSSSGSSAAATPRRGGDSSSIDDLLQDALAPRSGSRSGGSSAAASSSASTGSGGGGGAASGPEQPSRPDVMAAMNGVQGAVTACGNGEHGTATVAVTVAGSTGRVTGANVTGQFAGTPVGSCIARAVRGATFPRFTRPTFTFNFPFRI